MATMVDWTRLKRLDTRIRKARGKDLRADVTGLIRRELDKAKDVEERLYLLSELASAYVFMDRPKEAEAAIRAQIELAPDEPEVWMYLAEHLLYRAENLDEALETINVAVANATKRRRNVRAAHGVRIRIALRMQAFSLIEESLRTILAYSPEPGKDVILEDDFIRRIPEGAVGRDLLKAYSKAVTTERAAADR